MSDDDRRLTLVRTVIAPDGTRMRARGAAILAAAQDGYAVEGGVPLRHSDGSYINVPQDRAVELYRSGSARPVTEQDAAGYRQSVLENRHGDFFGEVVTFAGSALDSATGGLAIPDSMRAGLSE